jgi:hypothetical protein
MKKVIELLEGELKLRMHKYNTWLGSNPDNKELEILKDKFHEITQIEKAINILRDGKRDKKIKQENKVSDTNRSTSL